LNQHILFVLFYIFYKILLKDIDVNITMFALSYIFCTFKIYIQKVLVDSCEIFPLNHSEIMIQIAKPRKNLIKF